MISPLWATVAGWLNDLSVVSYLSGWIIFLVWATEWLNYLSVANTEWLNDLSVLSYLRTFDPGGILPEWLNDLLVWATWVLNDFLVINYLSGWMNSRWLSISTWVLIDPGTNLSEGLNYLLVVSNLSWVIPQGRAIWVSNDLSVVSYLSWMISQWRATWPAECSLGDELPGLNDLPVMSYLSGRIISRWRAAWLVEWSLSGELLGWLNDLSVVS
jgi:hypothetical protein